jgi:DNA-binding SARP family transcriptional activator
LRERDRLRVLHLDLLERLTNHYVATGNLTRGLAHGNRLLQLDPAREVMHRQLMRLYTNAGDRTGAVRQYRRCVAALATELDLEPDAETVALYQRIRTDAGSPAGPLPEARVSVAQQLDALMAAVTALQSEVRLLVDQHRGGGAAAGPTTLRPYAEVHDEWEAG